MLRRNRKSETSQPDYETYIPLAQDIMTHAQQAALGTGDIGADMSAFIDSLVERERARMVREAYGQMPAVDRMALMSQLFGDQELHAILENERVRILAQGAFTDTIQQLREDAGMTQCVDLSRVPLKAIVEINLYDLDDYDQAASAADLDANAYVARQIRGSVTSGGRVHILQDYFNDDEYDKSKPNLRTHSISHLGTSRADENGAAFTTNIYYGAPLERLYEDKISELRVFDDGDTIPLVVGSLVLADTEMFH